MSQAESLKQKLVRIDAVGTVDAQDQLEVDRLGLGVAVYAPAQKRETSEQSKKGPAQTCLTIYRSVQEELSATPCLDVDQVG